MSKKKSPTVRSWRQGDVLIMTAPAGAKSGAKVPRDATGRAILAAGELTGHHHAIASADAVLYERGDDDAALTIGDRILSTRRRVALTHEEHAPINLPAGRYLVRIQAEYDPTTMARRVED